MKWIIPPHFRERCAPGSFMHTLGTQYHPNYFHVHPLLGKGYVFVKESEPGLLIRNWNYQLYEDVEFVLEEVPENEDRLLSIICLQSIPPMLIRTRSGQLVQQGLNDLFVFNNTTQGSIFLPRGTDIRIVELLVQEEWLRLQYDDPEALKLNEVWMRLLAETDVKLVHVKNSVFYHSLLNAIASDVHRGAGAGILVKSRTLELIDFVVHQLLPEEMLQPGDEQMYALKDLLDAHVFGKLPSIEALASQFAMSTSTLKRKFRKAFGSGIYEYYIKKKMEVARTLLSNGDYRVSEVAFRLSYEKVSHFIEMFRRHYGTSPGQLRSRTNDQ